MISLRSSSRNSAWMDWESTTSGATTLLKRKTEKNYDHGKIKKTKRLISFLGTIPPPPPHTHTHTHTPTHPHTLHTFYASWIFWMDNKNTCLKNYWMKLPKIIRHKEIYIGIFKKNLWGERQKPFLLSISDWIVFTKFILKTFVTLKNSKPEIVMKILIEITW